MLQSRCNLIPSRNQTITLLASSGAPQRTNNVRLRRPLLAALYSFRLQLGITILLHDVFRLIKEFPYTHRQLPEGYSALANRLFEPMGRLLRTTIKSHKSLDKQKL